MMKKKYFRKIVVGLCMVLLVGTVASCKKTDAKVTGMESESEQQTKQNTSQAEQSERSDEGITYQWNEITFTMPQQWEEKYVVLENEQGVSIYHKMSYEKEEGMGYLFGIIKSEEWLNYGTGEQMIAYTENGMMYYLIRPTDVATDVEDEEILSEYMSMAEQIEQIARTVKVDANGVHSDARQFVIPVSSIVEIDEESLTSLSDNELWIACNEIYARHGKVFENFYLQSYFESCSWYTSEEGKDDVPENELSEIEQKNLEKMAQAEQVLLDEYSYPKKYDTNTNVQECLTGTDELNTISYRVIPGEYEDECILTIDDMVYDLSDFVTMENPETDTFFVTNLVQLWDPDSDDADGLEIAVLEYGPSDDLQTHFFKYDGNLKYIGAIGGFPFKEMNHGINGFNHQGGVTGSVRVDLLETSSVEGYWWYDSEEQKLVNMDMGLYTYQYYKGHELLVDLPVYQEMSTDSDTMIISASQMVYFLKTDMQEWIYVRAKDGTEGYVQVKDDEVLNVGLSSEKVFTDLYYCD